MLACICKRIILVHFFSCFFIYLCCLVSFRMDFTKDFIPSSDLLDFDEDEAFWAKVDVDSAHFSETVVMLFCPEANFLFDCVNTRINAANSSRFSVSLKNKGVQKIKIKVNDCYPEKINLGIFPNIKVLEVQVDGITKHFRINLYFVGTKYTHKTTYFCDYQDKAVTSLLNIARSKAISFMHIHESVNKCDQMSNMHLFESKTQGTQDRMMKKPNHISLSKMPISLLSILTRCLSPPLSGNMNTFINGF